MKRHMELALHLRHLNPKIPLEKGLDHLKTFYEESELEINLWAAAYPAFRRVYAGDEFCVNRLPNSDELKKIDRFCGDHGLNFTMLIPPLSNMTIKTCRPLFHYLSENRPGTEVVVNDMGVLWYIKKNHPFLSISMGRLFNKGFKDPRFQMTPDTGELPTDLLQLINESTFDQEAVIDMARDLSVDRMERDLFPFANKIEKRSEEIAQSVYFPFGYITTGRVCRISALGQEGRNKFLIQNNCNRLCNVLPLILKNDDVRFKLFQNGNTIFYLYPPSMLKRLLAAESDNRLRLVYQGFALS